MHHFAQNAPWIQEHICRARFEIIWTKEFAETETANHAANSILSSPDVREIESLKSTGATRQTVAIEVNTSQMDERDGGASWQRDENQLPTMDVSLGQKATRLLQKSKSRNTIDYNVESGIGDLRSVAGHQAQHADAMLPIEAMKFSANTIADVGYQYERQTGKLCDGNKCVAKHFSVIRRGRKVRPLMVLMCVWQRSHLKIETLCAGDLPALRSLSTKGAMASHTRKQ